MTIAEEYAARAPLRGRPAIWITAALAILGTAIHDLVEFGRPSEQNTLPVALIVITLVAVTERVPRWRRAGTWILAAFTAVILLGGAASVFPLPIWPFEPEQSVTHYVVHAVWVVSLCPLLVVTASRALRPAR